jgi:hypothetical protein
MKVQLDRQRIWLDYKLCPPGENVRVVRVDEKPSQGDGCVSTHGGKSSIVGEEDADVRISRPDELCLWSDDGAVHIVMPARLEYETFSDVIVLLFCLITLV